jgi:hypothetical protein
MDPVKEERTPDLVREFTHRKCENARGVDPTTAQHHRHCDVVDELRRRGVLD